MKKLVLLFSFFLSFTLLFSQPKIEFQKLKHDFGTMKEEGGRKTYDFVFINSGNAVLAVTQIVPSCGCTTPEWTKTPVPPGGTGYVRAIFEPMNMPGQFLKTLTVHSNSVPTPVILQIAGTVTPREPSIEELYTWPLGGLRFASQHLPFSNVKKNEKSIKVMQLINTSDKPITIGFDVLPAHLSMKATPETLKPGEKGLIEGTFNGASNAAWGPVQDYVRIKINGVVDNTSFLYVTASLVEDFSSLTREQLANAPAIKFESDVFDIGKMPVNQTKEIEFKFTNTGKSDLIIRHIRPTCGCTAIQQGKPVVAPGESSSIKAVFSSGASPSPQQKSILIYTNDPKSYEVILTIKGEVVK